MLNNPQINKMLGKLERFEHCLYDMIFERVDHIDFTLKETDEWLTEIPDSGYLPINGGDKWGAEGHYGWFKTDYTVPAEYAERQLFIYPDIGCYEGMLFINGKACGTFANKHQVQYTDHGNHYCDMIANNLVCGEKIGIVMELYCGHYNPGNHPFSKPQKGSYSYIYNGAYICIKNYEIQDIYFDLNAVRQLACVLPDNDFRRGEIISALYEVHNTVYYDAENVSRDEFMNPLRKIRPILKKILSAKAPESAPFAGLTGHSHMDTAWLWHVGETVKKCARTYSNALNLMEQYPEYRFIQSSSCHSDFIRKYYPELFERIREQVKNGRYEPNGGVWVECDCNITSGESMIRQFLWGQRFTRKYFNYTSDVFWLPDTFGYSAAIPQIMQGCGCKYFMTTKLGWNDTNRFPYDSFVWEGIDGTKVTAHFNTTHHYPNVEDMHERFTEQIAQPSVCKMKYASYGYGDGGGGPTFEMIESAKRCMNLDGLGTMKYMSASEFMDKLVDECPNMNTYKGELYLELHRGTLTNQHTIKRNNRKSEVALHDLEYVTVNNALVKGDICDNKDINPLYEVLLMNQFHDILPGTCINRAHVESRAQTTKLINDAEKQIELKTSSNGECVTVVNQLSFERTGPIFIDCKTGYIVKGNYAQQRYTDLDGNEKLIISGLKIPAFSSVKIEFIPGETDSVCFAEAVGNKLETPFASVEFNKKGGMSSFIDKRAERQLKGEGYDLNTLIMAEDVSCVWDNWDIDADIEGKFRDCAVLLSSDVVSRGACAYIIRNKYSISQKSTLTQDVMFFRDTPEIRFDTSVDWNEEHRLLKACFDTTVREDFARQEIQFGYVKRPTTRNNTVEQAKFEVLNHKYTDLSENRYGISILNDCKYGMMLNGSRMALSLHKGGVRPDHMGDKDGIHRMTYSFLPHNSGFNTKEVIYPAYELNYPVLTVKGDYKTAVPAVCSADNVIIETVKPCEDAEKAYIVRLYEAEGIYTNAFLSLPENIKSAYITNMLEENISDINTENGAIKLVFRPFEIKTVKVCY